VKLLGLALVIYQIFVYSSVEKACGPIAFARITGVSFSFHQIVSAVIEISAFPFLLFEICHSNFGFNMQIFSIPLLQSYPLIAMLSGISLYIVISIASMLKNVMSVSASLNLLNFSNRSSV
jgi:hypothetical protein